MRYTENIIRVGLGVTFLWIGVLIFKSPEAWGGALQPWALALLPIDLRTAMLQTAVFDIIVGFLLLIEAYPGLVSVLALFHLGTVITVVGINTATARDLGLAAMALALAIHYLSRSSR